MPVGASGMWQTVVPNYHRPVALADDRGSAEFDPYQVPVRPAATVMMVRDGTAGVEVAMLRRSLTASFVGGAYVFPGGAVDPHDASDEMAQRCNGGDDASLSSLLRVASGGMAFWVAAVRESFEEAGLLVANNDEGQPVDLSQPEVARRFVAHRSDVHSGRRLFADILTEERLHLRLDHIFSWSHWVTPIGSPRRFDTRFFLCAAPVGQEPIHDERETIASLWLTAADALQRFHDGVINLITPTIKSLEAIGHFPTVASLIDAAAPRAVPVVIPAPTLG